MLWLLVFLGVAVAIQARQTAAVLTAQRVARLGEQRAALEAERAALQRQVRLATGLKELGHKAETDLGLHMPQDSEFLVFPLPAHEH
jgi:Flp pilus assembly protein TadB